MSFEIKLVQEIEQYELLYNFKLAEHSRKDLVEKSWEEISNKVKHPVAECKEKWRNIRCSFLRSLKAAPKGSKPKKPYYLKEYLHFILPYLKPYINSDKTGTGLQHLTKLENTTPDSELSIHSEDLQNIDDYIEDENTIVENATRALTGEDEESVNFFTSSSAERRAKRTITKVEHSIISYLESKTRKIENSFHKENERNEDSDSARYFLLSLLPDVRSMTDEQQRFFRIKVTILIDEIHSNFQQCRSSHYAAFTNVPKSSSSSMERPSSVQ